VRAPALALPLRRPPRRRRHQPPLPAAAPAPAATLVPLPPWLAMSSSPAPTEATPPCPRARPHLPCAPRSSLRRALGLGRGGGTQAPAPAAPRRLTLPLMPGPGRRWSPAGAAPRKVVRGSVAGGSPGCCPPRALRRMARRAGYRRPSMAAVTTAVRKGTSHPNARTPLCASVVVEPSTSPRIASAHAVTPTGRRQGLLRRVLGMQLVRKAGRGSSRRRRHPRRPRALGARGGTWLPLTRRPLWARPGRSSRRLLHRHHRPLPRTRPFLLPRRRRRIASTFAT
jgi:hypothetical protein